MKIIKQILLAFIAFINISLSAQTVMSDFSAKNKVYFELGIEPASMLTLGYQRQFNEAIFSRNLFSYTEISSSMYSLGLNNSELKSGVIVPIVEIGKFKFANSFDLSVGNVKTNNFASLKLAFADKLALGIYTKKSFFALISEYEHVCLNRIKHTEYYRKTYYEEAKDGWYKGGGGAFQFGMEGGVTIKNKVDTYFELKAPFTEKLNAYGGSPFHIKLGVAYHF